MDDGLTPADGQCAGKGCNIHMCLNRAAGSSKEKLMTKPQSGNVIHLKDRLEGKMDRNRTTESVHPKTTTKVITITSGKGGVGKTNIVANLGITMSQLGKRVMILDADLGLGNLDILLGLAPRYNFSHFLNGTRSLEEVVVCGPEDIQILPAASGIDELTSISDEQRTRILSDLNGLLASVDILLIDTAAGISSNVTYFAAAAHEIVVVVSPEPTSITDAYALIKVLSVKYDASKFKLLVNMAANIKESQEVFRQLSMVTERFLDVDIEYIGYVKYDRNVVSGVKRQKAVRQLYPETDASRCLLSLARKLSDTPLPAAVTGGGGSSFWEKISRDTTD